MARLKAEGVITGGMIPKLETACNAVSGGDEVSAARQVDEVLGLHAA